MKTFTATPQTVSPRWYLVDATGQVLGRLASQLASRLRGKHKPEYTPHVDTGDYLVVLNSAQICVTGRKAEQKCYIRHSGYIGSIKKIKYSEMLEKSPQRILEHAVRGMLPKGPLGRAMFKKLKVYPGCEHHHQAQQPQWLPLQGSASK